MNFDGSFTRTKNVCDLRNIIIIFVLILCKFGLYWKGPWGVKLYNSMCETSLHGIKEKHWSLLLCIHSILRLCTLKYNQEYIKLFRWLCYLSYIIFVFKFIMQDTLNIFFEYLYTFEFHRKFTAALLLHDNELLVVWCA